jgi:hypothetical protein
LVDLDLYFSGRDPPESSFVVNHRSISESLQFSLSSSLGLPLPSPSLCEEKEEKKGEEGTTSVGKRERRKKI